MTGGSNFSRLKIFQLLLQLLGSRPACDFDKVQSSPAWSQSQLGSRCWVRQHEIYFVVLLFVSCQGMLWTLFFPVKLTLVSIHWCWHSLTKLETFIDHFPQIDLIPTAVSLFVLICWDFFLLFNLRNHIFDDEIHRRPLWLWGTGRS